MNKLVAKILLAILMFPLACLVYIGLLIPMASSGLDPAPAFLVATPITGVLVAFYWVMLWRGSVRWTGGRVVRTLLSVPACLVAGGVVGLIVGSSMRHEQEGKIFGLFIGGLLTILLWLAATVLLWRETPTERADRVQRAAGFLLSCPKCGYNMTGLYESRCPECGERYSLDQLYSAQRQGGIEDDEAAQVAAP
jgi:uncharacterized membrane protein YraQ (UPF0718 family)